MDINYISPSVRAMFLLDETGDDLQTAIDLALMNARKVDIECDRYWVAVADALTLRDLEN
ncbi:MAG: hypothetical protein WA830_03845 [Candidatus Sulfotelmatobacter sp.]